MFFEDVEIHQFLLHVLMFQVTPLRLFLQALLVLRFTGLNDFYATQIWKKTPTNRCWEEQISTPCVDLEERQKLLC